MQSVHVPHKIPMVLGPELVALKVGDIDSELMTLRTLRHSFATRLERNVDIIVIPILLVHKKLEATVQYAQQATEVLREMVNPLDILPKV